MDINENSNNDQVSVNSNAVIFQDSLVYQHPDLDIKAYAAIALNKPVVSIQTCIKEQETGISLINEQQCIQWMLQVSTRHYNTHPGTAPGAFAEGIKMCASLIIEEYQQITNRNHQGRQIIGTHCT